MSSEKVSTGTIEFLLFLIALACFSTCNSTEKSVKALHRIEDQLKEKSK